MLAGKNARGGMVFQPERGGLAVGGRKGGEDGFGGLAVGEVGRVDADGGGFAVEGFAGAVEFFECAAGVGGLEQGAFAVFDALVKVIGAGVEPDDGADLGEELAVGGGGDESAAGGHDEADAADEALQGAGFEGAEVFLAVLFENGGDGLAGFLRDEGVGIDEGEAGERGQDATDAGFAGSHESDEDQVAKHGQSFTTFRALGPRSLGLSSNSTVSPSSRVL
jgi:hypothetical protein